jgi:hypothetical protein
MGFSEERAWPDRAFLNRSPVMIQQLAAAAEQQGKMDKFLKSLEPGGKGSGGKDMRTPVEIGMITGPRNCNRFSRRWASKGIALFIMAPSGGSLVGVRLLLLTRVQH